MSDGKHVDVVKLDEKTLWKLKDKLAKLRAKENEAAKPESREIAERRKKSRPARIQIYQPGVTRLSNRKLAANFDQKTVENEENKPIPKNVPKKETTESRKNDPEQFKGDGDKIRVKESVKSPPTSANKNRRARRTNYRKKVSGADLSANWRERDEDVNEEGFLARHRRRKKEGLDVVNYSDEEVAKFEEDDELAWDNYGGSGLVHSSWSPQVADVASSSQEELELSDHEIKFDQDEEGKQEVEDEREEDHVETNASSDADDPSVATSESNKDYYKVTHSISSQSENEYNDDEEYELPSDIQRGREEREIGYEEDSCKPSSVREEERENEVKRAGKKTLFDPNNPDQPILVKKTDNRPKGHFAPSSDNVYNPNLSKGRLMINIKPKPRRKSPPPRNSPPRYHGNYYQDEWESPHDSPSPTRNYHYSAENLSEDEDTMTSQKHGAHRQSCMSVLHEAERHETVLSNLLSSPSFDCHEFNESLSRARNKLKILYESIIINDIEASAKHNVEQLLWRNVYYQVIEILREQIRSCPEQEGSELKINLVLLLDQGTAFYESLLENLQHKNHFNLKEILNNPAARKKMRMKARKRLKLAIVSCQRIFICLGDIARYREQANNSSNYGRSRHCYLQAQILAPKNGRPYNQLAILAVKTRHKLDAVYYYVRSLAASNPILTARESLMVLFDEIRRKLDYIEKKKDAEMEMANLKVEEVARGSNSRSKVDQKSGRRWEEVWILPGTDLMQREEREKDAPQPRKDPDLPELNLPLPEIAKHLVLFFLNIHGKLFTRTGLEMFPDVLKKTLGLFAVTLEHPKLMSSQRLLQLYAINLFAVLNADKLSIHGSVQDSTQNLNRALRLVFSMFAVTINEVSKVIESCITDSDIFESEHLAVLLPSVKVMFDWMYANKDCWYPPTRELIDPDLNVWESLAQLCNLICNDSRTKSPIRIYSEPDEALHEVFLSEDTQLAGFSPLGQAFSDPRYVDPSLAQEKMFVQQCVRVSLIRDFLEYLCGMEEPLLAFKQGRYVAVLPQRLSSWTDKPAHDDSFASSDYDMDDYSSPDAEHMYSSNRDSSADHDHGELNELRMYRDSLQLKKALHEKRQSEIQTSLESGEKVKLEICPKYLVPDTNCFIDHLHLIRKLIESGKFIVSTPLVVITELEGLATESKSDSAHAEHVYRSAKVAVDFINDCFAAHHPRFCALTRKGTELKTLRFRSENVDPVGNNDDIILQSTYAYSQVHSSGVKGHPEHTSAGERIVRRNVVLLTDDRNLRLKALLKQDMATKDLIQFCKWVEI